MTDLSVPIRTEGGASVLRGHVPVPSGWQVPDAVTATTVLVPDDVAAHAASGFVANVVVTTGEVLPGKAVVEVGTEHDVVLALDEVGDDGSGATRRSTLSLSSVDTIEVVQLTVLWQRGPAWFEVACSAALSEWDRWSTAFDELVDGSVLVTEDGAGGAVDGARA